MPTPAELAADAASETPDATAGIVVLVERMVELHSQLEAINAHRREVQKDYDELRKRYLPQVLGDKGLTSVRTPLGTLSLRTKTYASVPANRRAECWGWMLANEFAHMMTLEPAAALTLANVLIADGDPVPDFIKLFNEETVVLTRKKE